MVFAEVRAINGKIYAIRNNVNEKLYIGQTIQDVQVRFNQHMKPHNSPTQLIHRAVNKHGKESFSYDVLEHSINSYSELNEKEEFYIDELNSMSPNGYNLCPGGQQWRRRPVLLDDADNVVDSYNSGLSSRTIAGEYGVSHNAVLNILHIKDASVRNKSISLPDRTSKVTEDIMLDLYVEDGLTTYEIADRLNVSERTIRRARNRYDL